MQQDDVRPFPAPDGAPDDTPDDTANVTPDGWEQRQLKGFPTLVGPLLSRRAGTEQGAPWIFALRIGPQHLNLRDNVHGGLIATLADHTLGLTVWEAIGRKPTATIQLNVQYVASCKEGDFLEAQAEVVRVTRSVVFVRGLLRVGERVVATADGVWKVLGAA